MKSSTVLAAIATAVLLAVCLTAAPLQNPPAAPGGPGAAPGAQAPPAGRGPGAAQENKTATGQLSKVDLSKKEITIKEGDKEMVFEYNDATQMTGVDNSAQGLSGKTGSTLRVTYREQGGKNLASRIEVQGGGAGAPGAPGGAPRGGERGGDK